MSSTKDIVEGIRRDLGIEAQKEADILDEAYVAMPKKYDMKTELLSGKNKAAHVELYQGYVKTLNRSAAELDTAPRDEDGGAHSRYRALKKDEVFNMNTVYLHELFFSNISDVHSEIRMDTLAYMRLERDFGTFEDWQWDFIANATVGRGWAVCAYSTYLQKFINFFVDSNDVNIPIGCYPVIVLDVFEHSYYRDYLADRKSYIYAMMKELDWDIIEERVKRADMIGMALR